MKSLARLVLLLVLLGGRRAYGQELTTLEQRQPLELVFADSIVPQDRHEMMLTTGGWYSRPRGDIHDALLTQKIEWGICRQAPDLNVCECAQEFQSERFDFDRNGRL
jgi:hypothetical protein